MREDLCDASQTPIQCQSLVSTTVHPTPETSIGIARLHRVTFLAQVAVADLDLKPLEKIDEHYELDCAIMHQAKQQRFASLLS